MAPVGPPEPFLDRPGSPPVPWVQWIREFSLFLDQERYAEEEDKSRTLLRHLGQEGCRVLCSVLDPNGTPTRTRTQTGTQTRTWTYEEMVSALTKHYDTKKRNSKMYTAAAVGGAAFFGLGAVAAAPFVLAGIGFTSAGIAAGSYAAGMMSSAAIANGGAVAAGSLVAVLQSAGAAGLSAGASAVVGGVGAAVGGAVGALVIGAE